MFLEKKVTQVFLSKKSIFSPPHSAETPRSSSWPRTSGFHPEDQGFESPTRYKMKSQLFTNEIVGIFVFMVLARIWHFIRFCFRF